MLNRILFSMTARSALAILGRNDAGGWTVDAIFDLFPSLAERRRNAGNCRSGGKQQMLVIGRALAGNLKVLSPDEPLEDLAPIIAEQLLATLVRITDEAADDPFDRTKGRACPVVRTSCDRSGSREAGHGESGVALQADPETQRRLSSVAGDALAVAAEPSPPRYATLA